MSSNMRLGASPEEAIMMKRRNAHHAPAGTHREAGTEMRPLPPAEAHGSRQSWRMRYQGSTGQPFWPLPIKRMVERWNARGAEPRL
jgi:hypothetical protein